MADAPPIPWPKFLESHPPGSAVAITEITEKDVPPRVSRSLIQPPITLHCPTEECSGPRNFEAIKSYELLTDKWRHTFLVYLCRNCRKSEKTYALLVRHTTEADGEAIKVGEWPPFGPHVPARVITLIGPDKDLFLRGRRSENQGLGVGAFAYYRQVVDNQWKRILDEVIKVAKRTKAPAEAIAHLEKARAETQFSRAVELVRDVIPPSLLIDGHNPLVLLYGALSDGLHEGRDEECLDLATSIRALLTNLAEQIGQALKEEQEVKKALSKLLRTPSLKKPEVPG